MTIQFHACCLLFIITLAAFPAQAASQEWDAVVKRAEQEGQVSVYATDSIGNAPMIWAAFQKRYPKITALYQNFYRAKVVEPIPPMLIHPNVTDLSKWWAGKHHYVDPEAQYVFMYESALYGPPISFNTSIINEKEIKSAWDLVQPQWKGKYAALQLGPSQGSTALTYVYYHPQLGPKFIERVYRDLEPTLFRELRQGTDWLSQGKFPLCFLCRRIDRAAMQGLPVAELNPYQVEEKPGLGSGSGALVLLNRYPNPNGAKVFLNWFLSLEGQIAFRQANTDELRVGSLREDLPPEVLPPMARRRKDKDYVWINRPEWMDFRPINNLLEELRKGR